MLTPLKGRREGPTKSAKLMKLIVYHQLHLHFSTTDTQSSYTSLKRTVSTEIKDSQVKVYRREHEDSLLDPPLDYQNQPNLSLLKDFGLENVNSLVQMSDDLLSSSSTSFSTIDTQSSNTSLKRTAPTEIKSPEARVCKRKHDRIEPLSLASSIKITDTIQPNIFLGKVNISESEDTIVVGTDGTALDQNLQDDYLEDDYFENEFSQTLSNDDVIVRGMLDKDEHSIEEKKWSSGAGTTDDALSSNKDDHANDENELPSPSLFLDCDWNES
jgi:hypothetical protein